MALMVRWINPPPGNWNHSFKSFRGSIRWDQTSMIWSCHVLWSADVWRSGDFGFPWRGQHLLLEGNHLREQGNRVRRNGVQALPLLPQRLPLQASKSEVRQPLLPSQRRRLRQHLSRHPSGSFHCCCSMLLADSATICVDFQLILSTDGSDCFFVRRRFSVDLCLSSSSPFAWIICVEKKIKRLFHYFFPLKRSIPWICLDFDPDYINRWGFRINGRPPTTWEPYWSPFRASSAVIKPPNSSIPPLKSPSTPSVDLESFLQSRTTTPRWTIKPRPSGAIKQVRMTVFDRQIYRPIDR